MHRSHNSNRIARHALQLITFADCFRFRSMTDLVSDSTSAHSPRRKFSFRFPHLAHHQSVDKDTASPTAQSHHAKGAHSVNRARNFTDEIKNLPDLQVIFAIPWALFVPLSITISIWVDLYVNCYIRVSFIWAERFDVRILFPFHSLFMNIFLFSFVFQCRQYCAATKRNHFACTLFCNSHPTNTTNHLAI